MNKAIYCCLYLLMILGKFKELGGLHIYNEKMH